VAAGGDRALAPRLGRDPASVLRLQRAIGNRATCRILQRDIVKETGNDGTDFYVDTTIAPGWPTPPSDLPAIPAPLLRTLYYSYYHRVDGDPSASHYLDNAFGKPKTLWEALRGLGGDLAMMKQIYDRWTGAGINWVFVKAITNSWRGTSDGFNFVSDNVGDLEKALGNASTFCHDHVGEAYHWWEEGSSPCWREVVNGGPGLHVCTGAKSGPTVHIDPHQIVKGKHWGGLCNYDLGTVEDHYRDLGWLPKWWPSWL
jgi:hypothetical protein